ncbi:MAG: OPT family oligopeptide transporter [Myxococcales bacterium]|nr:OPT family oligopeptide transporter [Myxococcales bacterium]
MTTAPTAPIAASPAAHAVPPPADDAPQAEHDRWWLDNVYQGDAQAQLTLRAVATGCVIGGIMSISNLYVGLKIGWGLGVAITSAVLAFALFTTLQKVFGTPASRHFTILENNTMQTAASAAGYMTSAGLVSAVPALYMSTKQSLSVPQIMAWMTGISLLGIVAAIPVKRKLINQERLRFPSGIACAETLRSLHGTGDEGVVKGKALALTGIVGGLIAFVRDGIHVLPDKFAIFGKAAAIKSVAFEPSMVMIAAGALMGVRVTFWMFLGGLLSRYVLPPYLLQWGFITCAKVPAGGVCTADLLAYGEINKWTLWPGVALMVSHSLVGLALQLPKMLRGVVATVQSKQAGGTDPRMAALEAPASWFWGGLAVAGTACVVMADAFFGIPPHWGALAVAMALALAFVAARTTGETDVNPVGAMGKVPQMVFGAVMPGSVPANLMAANITAGCASHCGDLLTDIKTGYLLGAKARFQVIAQVFGIAVGAVFATLGYTLLVNPDELGSEKWPAPAAVVWQKVAELLAQGVSAVEPHKLAAIQYAALAGASFAIIESLVPARSKRWLPSIAGFGVAMTFAFSTSASMFLGACLAWSVARSRPAFAERFTAVAASGFIAGETLMAVGIIAWGVLFGGK